MRALLFEGKAPKPEVETSNGLCRPLRCSSACVTRSNSSCGTLPRNFRVRWIFSWPISRKSLLAGKSRAAQNSASLTSGGGKTATKVLTLVLAGTGFSAVLVGRAAGGGAVGDQGGRGSRSDAVIHVDDREAGGAGLEHSQDGRGSVAA